MSRVSGVAEQVRVMIVRGEIGLGEPIGAGLAEVHRLARPPAAAPHGPLLDAIVADDQREAPDAARVHVLGNGG